MEKLVLDVENERQLTTRRLQALWSEGTLGTCVPSETTGGRGLSVDSCNTGNSERM